MMKKPIAFGFLCALLLSISCDKEAEPETVDSPFESEAVELTDLLTDAEVAEFLDPSFKASKSRLDARGSARFDRADVLDYVNGGTLAGKAKLLRGRNGLFLIFWSDKLIPHHTYTVWWAAWNNPEYCVVPGQCGFDLADFGNLDNIQAEFMYATGRVANYRGKALFWAYIGENDDSGSVNDIFGFDTYGGLHDAQSAEIHAILRSHGPKIPGQVAEQIGTWGGGCSVFFDPFTQIPLNSGECGDIFAAVFP